MKNRIKYLLSCFLLLASCSCFGQNIKTDSLLAILKSEKDDTNKVNTLNKLFIQYEFSDDKVAKEYLNKAVELSNKIDDKKGLASTYIHLGYSAEDKGNYQDALKNYFISLKINKIINNKIGTADSYNNIGSIFFYLGNYPEALKNYFISLKIEEVLNTKPGMAYSYNDIGLVYEHQGNYQEALRMYLASLKIKEMIGDKVGLGASYNNIGDIYNYQGNYSEALKNYFISLKIRESVNNKNGIADSYNNIGSVYESQSKNLSSPELRSGVLNQALKCYFISLKIREAVGNKTRIISSYVNIGNVYIKQKKYKDAEEILTKGKNLCQKIGIKEYFKDTYGSLSELDSAKGNYKGAYENHKLYILYRDSLDNEETRKKTIQSQMTYDFEKKEAVATAEHKKELENQQVLADEKSRKQRMVLLLVSCFLLLVLFFAGFIFRSLRTTRKQKNIIEEQKNLVEQQKKEVEQQKLLVEEHQKEIIDSIYYARRIQRSLLPTEKYIEKNLKRLKKE